MCEILAIARVEDTSDVRKVTVEKQRLDTLLLHEARAKYSEIAGSQAANELKDAHQHQNRGLGVTKAQCIEATMDHMENGGIFDTRYEWFDKFLYSFSPCRQTSWMPCANSHVEIFHKHM